MQSISICIYGFSSVNTFFVLFDFSRFNFSKSMFYWFAKLIRPLGWGYTWFVGDLSPPSLYSLVADLGTLRNLGLTGLNS